MGGVNCSCLEREFRATPDMDKDGNVLGWKVIIQTGRYYEVYIPAAPRMVYSNLELRVRIKRMQTIRETWAAQAGKRNEQLDFIRPLVSARPEETELVSKAKELAIDMGHCSVPMLQRNLKIPYQQASRLIDTLEIDKVIGPNPKGQKHREVLVAA